MNNKYVNIYSVGITLVGLFVTLLLSNKLDFTELTIVLISFVFILLAFKLSCPNKFDEFINSSKKYYIAICVLIPFAIFLRVQISEELPSFINKNIASSNISKIKVQDFTHNDKYIKLFQTSTDNLIVKPVKTQIDVSLHIFSLSEVCENINNNFRSTVQLFSWVVLIILIVFYFGLFIGIKLSLALSQKD